MASVSAVRYTISYATAGAALLLLLALWWGHGRHQPFALRVQNSLESWLYASNALLVASALGYTLQLPTEERFLNSREDLEGQIATLLGGRSAEEIVFGKITTGAANDLQRATDIAEQMVGTYGMSDTLGPLAYDKQGGGRFLGGNNNPRRAVSDATAQAIDREVRGLVDRAHDQALSILRVCARTARKKN